MKLAFIQAPAWGRDCPPYTMCFFAALVRQKNHQAYLFDLNNALYQASPRDTKKMWDDKDYYSYWENREVVNSFIDSQKKIINFYIEKILASEAKIIGFTVHFSSVWASLEIARRIKERDKSRIIVFGGPDCAKSQKGRYLILQDCVDIVVYAEGEYALFEIIDNFDNLEAASSIKGCLILRDGSIVEGIEAPIINNLDSLPAPDYSDFKDDIRLRMYREPQRLDIFDSRGCITCCHFCSEWQFWKKFRSKSGRKIYEEIVQHMRDFPQVNYFYFIGSLINGDMKALESFCDLVISNNLKIQWAAQAVIRPEMTEELLKKIKRSGCNWLSYGIESGSQGVLDRMNKRFSLDTAACVLQNTKNSGIATQANFMFGLPTETEDDFNQTLSFLKANREYMDTILASQSFCVVDKGTHLYNHPQEFGLRNKEHHLYWESNNGDNNFAQRLYRYEEFCKLALSLGIPERSGVLSNKPDKWHLLGDYFLYKRDYQEAIKNYLSAECTEIRNRSLLNKLSSCYEETGDYLNAKETLLRSLKIKSSQEDTMFSDEAISQRIAFLEGITDNHKADEAYDKIESFKLARLLQYYARIKYREIDLGKILAAFDFNEKQRSMCLALYSHSLWDKLSNYILVDVQKARREAFVFGYPYWLVIDPCNYCNLHCPFCPTGQGRQARTRCKLNFNDFKHIIDKLGKYLIHIDLVNWGEPFLNEQTIEMIKYAKHYKADIKVDTNMNSLNKENIEKLILSGLDKIVVSIDGLTQDSYAKYRRGGDFRLAMDNLKFLVQRRKEFKRDKPYITWQFLVFRHNEGEINEAVEMGKTIGVDHIGITKSFIGQKEWIPLNRQYSNYNICDIDDNGPTFDHFKADSDVLCNWPWEAVAINSNNSVSACCSVEEEKDDFGNFFNQPFEELWNGKNYQAARRHIKDKAKIPVDKNICIGCRHTGLINVDILSCHSFFDS